MTERRTILLAEDDGVLRWQMALMLGGEYEVVSAKDGAEALALYLQEPERFALVLTDCEMPLSNGIQLTVRLWRQDPRLPVIMMTGGMERADFRGLLRTRNFALLWKPFDILRLKELIECLLGRDCGGDVRTAA
jgi:two-component system sensor histidine kinase EvgS